MKKGILLLIFLVGFVLVGCNDKVDAELGVDTKNVTLEISETHEIKAVLKNTEDTAVFKFVSDNTAIAEVNTNGLVTAISAGTAKITVTVEGFADLKATVTITVNEGEIVDQLTVTGPTTVVAGEEIKLTVVDKLDKGSGIVWIALTPTIAKVAQDGTITGLTAGTAEFEIHSMENGFNIKIEIEVTKAEVETITLKANVTGEKIKTTSSYRLSATVLPKAAEQDVVWETSDDSIASIDQNGNVNIVSYGEVTFTAKSVEDDEVFGELSVEFYWDVMDIMDFVMVENPVIQKKVTAVGFQFNYDVDVLGSVSNFYFGNYTQYEKLAPTSNENRPGTIKTSTEFITIHDTASTASSAGAASHANYVFGGGGGTSWHYSIGNDGVWLQIPHDEVAYHAGDGSRVYTLNDTGVKVTSKVRPKIEIDTAGYYTLNGERTKIIAPKDGDRILTTAHINDDGIVLEIGDNGNWMMNSSWYSTTYKLIGNHGGNRNSIGIETMVNQGADLYLTWHYTAKKSAELALEYNLGVERITTHQFFSGKNCPQTLRDNDLYDNFRDMIEAEYLVNKFLGDYTFEFISNNTDLVDNNGRILKIPTTNTQVSFLVTVKNNAGFNQSKLYYSTIPAK